MDDGERIEIGRRASVPVPRVAVPAPRPAVPAPRPAVPVPHSAVPVPRTGFTGAARIPNRTAPAPVPPRAAAPPAPPAAPPAAPAPAAGSSPRVGVSDQQLADWSDRIDRLRRRVEEFQADLIER